MKPLLTENPLMHMLFLLNEKDCPYPRWIMSDMQKINDNVKH